ncbi:MAG: transporter permease, partial [Thermomicrobiales bacterium]|nr:transporter permease [Thermomicrobiales bacterium]
MAVRPAEPQTTENGRGPEDRVPFPPASAASAEAGREARPTHFPWQRVPYVWFLLPALAGYGAFFVYPTIRAFYLSLFDLTGVGPIGEFIGLRHFVELMRSDRFWRAALHSGQLFLYIFV